MYGYTTPKYVIMFEILCRARNVIHWYRFNDFELLLRYESIKVWTGQDISAFWVSTRLDVIVRQNVSSLQQSTLIKAHTYEFNRYSKFMRFFFGFVIFWRWTLLQKYLLRKFAPAILDLFVALSKIWWTIFLLCPYMICGIEQQRRTTGFHMFRKKFNFLKIIWNLFLQKYPSLGKNVCTRKRKSGVDVFTSLRKCVIF